MLSVNELQEFKSAIIEEKSHIVENVSDTFLDVENYKLNLLVEIEHEMENLINYLKVKKGLAMWTHIK